ncbi:MAG: methionyl-tRNA formyltransferase [Lachnospiraceae bacterium]|nr:methionyl-tRNA formyltransferase [Lachnospiraceae bacterium]
MKAVYFGSPELSAIVLEYVLKAGIEIQAVVTQTDKPKGRGEKMAFSAVKEVALREGIEVLQPLKMKEPDFLKRIEELNPDVILVAAFGRIIPKVILDLPKYGCINVHTSLLPKYRGTSPIQAVILKGEEKTGVTIMYMDEGIDTGDIMLSKEVAIEPTDTGASLHDKLALMGGPLLIEALKRIENKRAIRIKQPAECDTYVQKISKEDGIIDYNAPAIESERKVRAFNPWPSAFTYLNGKVLKVWKSKVNSDEGYEDYENGQCAYVKKDCIGIKTADGILELLEVQSEGKKRMDVKAFLNGNSISEGMKFGE